MNDNQNVERMKNVPPFVKFVCANVPMVFDDSLSYYEALCALWKYVQDCVDVINNNATLEEEYIAKFEELKTFVDTYFENLDVQEEINNKLDDMADSGELETLIVSYFRNFQLDYESFGAVGDGVTDDYAAIKATHDYANLHNLPVKAQADKTYYVKNITSAIEIKTDTDWNGASFIIDDTGLPNNVELFNIASDNEVLDLVTLPSSVLKGQTYISQLASLNNVIVEMVNSYKKDFIRTGGLAGDGSDRTEIFRCDKGYVLDEIFYDFSSVTSIKYREIDTTPLTVKNGTFTTIINTTDTYNYQKRNIRVERDNVTLEGICHYLDGENTLTSSPYEGFIYTGFAYNINVNNCVVTGHKTFVDSGSNTDKGNYDIQNNKTLFCYMNNVQQSNDIRDTSKWGVHTSNYSKNLYFNICRLSRIDSHRGLLNVYITNSELGHHSMRLIGGGECLIEGVQVINATEFLRLRNDYGASWNGDITIKNCSYTDQAGSYYRCIIRAINDEDHDYGYKCYLGKNIKIENFKFLSTVDDRCYIINTGENVAAGISYTDNYETNATNEVYPAIYPSSIECKDMSCLRSTGYFCLTTTAQRDIQNEYCENVGNTPTQSDVDDDYSLSNVYDFNCKIVFDNVPLRDDSATAYAATICSLWTQKGYAAETYQNTHRPIMNIIVKNCNGLKLGISGRAARVTTDNCNIYLMASGYSGNYAFFNIKNSIIHFEYLNTSAISSSRVAAIDDHRFIFDNCEFKIQSGLTLSNIYSYERPFNTLNGNANNFVNYPNIYYNNKFWPSFVDEFYTISRYQTLMNDYGVTISDFVTNTQRRFAPRKSGTTAQRPSVPENGKNLIPKGSVYYDTTTSTLVHYDGTNWV